MKLKIFQGEKLTSDRIRLHKGVQTADTMISANLEAQKSMGGHYLLEDIEYIKLSIRRVSRKNTATLIRILQEMFPAISINVSASATEI